MPNKRTILLVEPNDRLRRSYSQVLVAEGYDVHPAKTGNEALKQLDIGNIDLAVLELALPDVEGMELLLRFPTISRKTKVIVYTTYLSYQRNFRSWAADAFLAKSRDLTKLKNTIMTLLKTRGGQ